MFDYEVPLIGSHHGQGSQQVSNGSGSQLPLIVGLKSFKTKNAVLELEDGKEIMTFPGPGGYQINWSPGTVRIPMEQAMSGHLMVGCDNSDLLPQNRGGIEPAISTLPVIPDQDAKTSQNVHSVQLQDSATPREWHPQQPSPDQ